MNFNPVSDSDILKNELIFGPRRFFLDAQKELARVKRHGGKSTFALIKPHFNLCEINNDYLTSLYFYIKEQLRECDSLYIFDKDTFVAILPETHEAGGEIASARIKRAISQNYTDPKHSIPMSIGIVSVWSECCPNVTDLVEELKKDLARDQKCQFLPRQSQPRLEKKRVCVLVGGELRSRLDKVLPSEAFEISEEKDIDDAELIIFQEKFCRQRGVDIKLLQKNSQLQCIANIKVDGDSIIVASRSSLDPVEFVARLCFVNRDWPKRPDPYSRKYEDILSAIGSSTHQLNQPLQIMMGKIELLLLDLSLGEDVSRAQIQEALKQIKEQVHYASEINSKINRLTKS